MLQKKFVDEMKTHMLCSITLFSPENYAGYEIMRKNIGESGRPQMAWCMRIAYWIS